MQRSRSHGKTFAKRGHELTGYAIGHFGTERHPRLPQSRPAINLSWSECAQGRNVFQRCLEVKSYHIYAELIRCDASGYFRIVIIHKRKVHYNHSSYWWYTASKITELFQLVWFIQCPHAFRVHQLKDIKIQNTCIWKRIYFTLHFIKEHI